MVETHWIIPFLHDTSQSCKVQEALKQHSSLQQASSTRGRRQQMTTDDAGLLDEIQEASDVDTLTVAEEAIVAHPPAEPCKKNLRKSSALDIAERCSERFGLTQAVCESAKFLREVDKKSRRLLYLDQLSQFVAGSQVRSLPRANVVLLSPTHIQKTTEKPIAWLQKLHKI